MPFINDSSVQESWVPLLQGEEGDKPSPTYETNFIRRSKEKAFDQGTMDIR